MGAGRARCLMVSTKASMKDENLCATSVLDKKVRIVVRNQRRWVFVMGVGGLSNDSEDNLPSFHSSSLQ